MKIYCHIWRQHPWFFYLKSALSNFSKCKVWTLLNFSKCKTLSKKKILKFEPRNWNPEMPYFIIFRLNFEKLLWYLKSTPSNLSKSTVSHKSKNSQIWDIKFLIWKHVLYESTFCFVQKCPICVFLGSNFKNLLSYLTSTSSNLSNMSLRPFQRNLV